jgi:neutral ceramidase
MKFRWMFSGIVVASLLLSVTVCLAQTGNLRVGAARVDISPTKDMFPFKSMQVYGSVHDPVFVRALVLDNGSAKAALISVDAADIIYGNELIKAVTDELKIPAENLIMSATHDHNAPLFGSPGTEPAIKSPYVEIVKKGIIEAARQANANLQPARIGFGTGKAYVNTNRDEKIGEGYHMGYAPNGPSDKTVAVILLAKPSGEPIAIYADYAVHSVVMFRTHTQDGQVQITSDLAGWTVKYVEDHFKDAVALWAMGAAGDQNPLCMMKARQAGRSSMLSHAAWARRSCV